MRTCMTAVYIVHARRIAIIMKPHIMLWLKSLALPQGLLLTEYNNKTSILMQNTIIHMAHDLQSHNRKQLSYVLIAAVKISKTMFANKTNVWYSN